MFIRESSFIQAATTGKRLTRWWLAILIFVVFFMINVGVISGFALVWPVADGSAAAQVQEGIGSVISILVVLSWVTCFERRSIASLGFRRPGRGVLALLLGIVVGLAMISLPIVLLWAAGVYRTAAAPAGASSGWSALPIVLLLLLTVIAQGSNEEILVRGFYFQSLGAQLPGWLAVLIPTLSFTLVHGVVARAIPFITIFGFGVFAILVVLRLGSLWLICGLHAGWNWALGNVFGLSVSSLDPHTNALVYLEAAPGQPEWLTGGDFGTEGSLAAAIMIVVVTAIMIALYRRHRDVSLLA